MGDIAAITSDEDGVTGAGFAATATGGDAVVCANDGNKRLFIFRNDHSAAIDVTMVSQFGTKAIQGVGKVTKASKTKTVPANGGYAVFELGPNEIGGYLDNASKVQFTYANWNALLKLLAINAN